MSPSVLVIDRVSKRFGSSVAVDNVSLDLRAGEFFTLLGPSGCGKTTLLRMLSGFETPDTGTLQLDGLDITSLPPYRRNVNQVFQSYALFPHLSVRRNIEFGLRVKRLGRTERTRKVDDVLALVAMTGLADRKPAQLSGGQKQRVALARALVCEPRVLLLDEPLAALDAKLRRSMQVELKRLQHRVGITFVFVTHDQEEALTLSDRIGVMNAGRLQQVGTAQDVYHRPASSFVASFLGHANLHPVTVQIDGALLLADGSMLHSGAPPVHQVGLHASVRPENLVLHTRRPPGVNVFEASVEECHFKGSADQLLLKSAGGLLWNAIRFQGEPVAVGSRVFVQIAPAAVVTLV